jgi:uncharacterized protein YccT (UPF0319 family)
MKPLPPLTAALTAAIILLLSTHASANTPEHISNIKQLCAMLQADGDSTEKALSSAADEKDIRDLKAHQNHVKQVQIRFGCV